MQTKHIDLGGRSWLVRDVPGDREAIDEVYVQDGYDVGETIQGLARRKEPRWYLDVGAHVGAFTALVLRHDPSANVIAVEPNRESVALLRENVGPAENVRVVEKALRHDGANQLTSFSGSTMGCKVVHHGDVGGDYPALYRVATVTIFKLLGEFGVRTFDLVKLDCELSEHDILPAMARVPRRMGTIVGEWHAMEHGQFSARLTALFPTRRCSTTPYPSNATMGKFRVTS